MSVQLSPADKGTKFDDVRNLSGGERSFITLSLLLALGSRVEAPFRIMDEYDVFMDQTVRSLTLREILDQASHARNKNKQFIIVTPQQLNDIKTSNTVRIHKMPNPTRETVRGLKQRTITLDNAEN